MAMAFTKRNTNHRSSAICRSHGGKLESFNVQWPNHVQRGVCVVHQSFGCSLAKQTLADEAHEAR